VGARASSYDTIHDDEFHTSAGVSIGSGGDGFYANPCTNSMQPFGPPEAGMRKGNNFMNVCIPAPTFPSNAEGLHVTPVPGDRAPYSPAHFSGR
jgi:hypothetical protein